MKCLPLFLYIDNFSIVSAWALIALSKPQPSNFICPPGTEKALTIPACCTGSTITLVPILE